MRAPLLLAITLLAGCAGPPKRITISSVEEGEGPRILAVIAHPDDESAFAGAVFASAVEHGSAVDVLCITNGEGGFKYSTLAERIYGEELTQELVGRAELPAIREAELTRALGWLGVRRLLLLLQTDHRYTTDLAEVMPSASAETGPWDLPFVREELGALLNDLLTNFPLQSVPDPSTIRVFVDDEEITAADLNGQGEYSDGWSYDPSQNAISFHGSAVPDYNAEVEIYYLPLSGMPRELPF